MATPNGATDTSQEKGPQCEEIIIDITVKKPKWGSECCIYKVPKRLRKVKEQAYTPKLVSIGPVHHDNDELKDMQKLKMSYFKEFFDRTCKDQKEFASIVKKNIQKIRDCYAVEISLPEKEEDLRHFFRPPDHQNTGNPIEHRHSATKLEMAGLIFQTHKEKRSLLNVQIQKGNSFSEIFPCFNCSWLMHCLPCLKKISLLERMQTRLVVPHFVVDNKTEDLFRNLMALEQCHYPNEAYICNYVLLLDFLINNKDDVELLVEEGIIVNSLGSNKAVADMVNKLGHEIVEKNSYYHEVAEDLNRYYRNWWNQNMASLKTVYFRDIWRGTATVVGIIVLVVTVMNFLRPFVFKHI
ncbi:hypothetical protein CMV_023981 [Castanea mollissima]|uniref:Uncharacterized protein n=1 Tax=Castanea mollissima TaxID=60419 RepID=A0A8J4VII8_9ROSI|nr:hypothetical protein CMV_023981 [Castanea mollissima]